MASIFHFSKAQAPIIGFKGILSLQIGALYLWHSLHYFTSSIASLYSVGHDNPVLIIALAVTLAEKCPPKM